MQDTLWVMDCILSIMILDTLAMVINKAEESILSQFWAMDAIIVNIMAPESTHIQATIETKLG